MEIKRNPPIPRGFWAPFLSKWRYNNPKEYKPCFLSTGRGNLSKFCGRVAVAKFWSRRRRIRKNGVADAHQLRQAARASAVLAAKYRTFCEKLCQKWGTLVNRGQTTPAGSTPRAGNSHPVGVLPPPHSNNITFLHWPAAAAAPQGTRFGRLPFAKSHGRGELRLAGQPAAAGQPAGGRPG